MIFAVVDIARTSAAVSNHLVSEPWLRTVWNMAAKLASPSKIKPSTKGEKPSSGMYPKRPMLFRSGITL